MWLGACHFSGSPGLAELADAAGSNLPELCPVWVRHPPNVSPPSTTAKTVVFAISARFREHEHYPDRSLCVIV
jgi:hypothetical protein